MLMRGLSVDHVQNFTCLFKFYFSSFIFYFQFLFYPVFLLFFLIYLFALFNTVRQKKTNAPLIRICTGLSM